MIPAHRRSSSRSSLISTVPSTVTNEKGGASSSTQSDTRGSRRSIRPFSVSAWVVNTREPSSSSANQIGATCGRPSLRTWASLPVCGGSEPRNASASASVIAWYGTARSAGGNGEVHRRRRRQPERVVRPAGLVAVELEEVLHQVRRPLVERGHRVRRDLDGHDVGVDR